MMQSTNLRKIVKKPPATLPKPKNYKPKPATDFNESVDSSNPAKPPAEDPVGNRSYLFSHHEEWKSNEQEPGEEEVQLPNKTLINAIASELQAAQAMDVKIPLRPPKKKAQPQLNTVPRPAAAGYDDVIICLRNSPGRDGVAQEGESENQTDSGIASSSPTLTLETEETQPTSTLHDNTLSPEAERPVPTFVCHLPLAGEQLEVGLPTIKRLSPVFCQNLWKDLPQVQDHLYCNQLEKEERTFYEAKYEIISTESSFNGSMHVYNNVFIRNQQLAEVITVDDFSTLFARAESVRICSDHLLTALNKCLNKDIFMKEVVDVFLRHIGDIEKAFVQYCSHQNEMQERFSLLMREKANFKPVIKMLLQNPACKNLCFDAFIIAPIQRVTRLPLLFDKLLHSFRIQDQEHAKCSRVLDKLRQIVLDCNEMTRTVDQQRIMKQLDRNMTFPPDIPAFPIIKKNRYLVMSGEFTRHQWTGDDSRLTHNKTAIHLLLFSDMLMVVKKRGDLYQVIDYCSRHLAVMSRLNGFNFLPSPITMDSPGCAMVLLTLIRNYEIKPEQMLLSLSSDQERAVWIQKTQGQLESEEDILEVWDSVHVTATSDVQASESDNLELKEGDRLQVLRVREHGWYYGLRKSDGACGLFHASHVVDDCPAHARARTLKKLYNILNEME